jgi:hypothetical protein
MTSLALRRAMPGIVIRSATSGSKRAIIRSISADRLAIASSRKSIPVEHVIPQKRRTEWGAVALHDEFVDVSGVESVESLQGEVDYQWSRRSSLCISVSWLLSSRLARSRFSRRSQRSK